MQKRALRFFGFELLMVHRPRMYIGRLLRYLHALITWRCTHLPMHLPALHTVSGQ